jgi:hypothetical protein
VPNGGGGGGDDDSPPQQGMRSAIEVLTSIAAPATVLGGIVVYLGWIRTQALYTFFGIDSGLLGYSTQDYVLRSAGVIFLPLLCIFLAAAVGLAVLALI